MCIRTMGLETWSLIFGALIFTSCHHAWVHRFSIQSHLWEGGEGPDGTSSPQHRDTRQPPNECLDDERTSKNGRLLRYRGGTRVGANHIMNLSLAEADHGEEAPVFDALDDGRQQKDEI